MISLRVETDFSRVRRYLTDVQKNLVPKAAGIALGRVGKTVRAAASKRIREKLAIKVAVVNKAIDVKREGMRRLAVVVEASGEPIPLRDYQARQTKKGATYRVSKGGARKRYQREGRTGFIVDSRGGHVFVRVEADPPGPTKARIKKVFGPSIPQYFVTKLIWRLMEDTARARWPVEFHAALRGVLLRKTGVDIGIK